MCNLIFTRFKSSLSWFKAWQYSHR